MKMVQLGCVLIKRSRLKIWKCDKIMFLMSDQVGACVGIGPGASKNIVNELGNEQIDMVQVQDANQHSLLLMHSPAKGKYQGCSRRKVLE